jgi:hypothetical protein
MSIGELASHGHPIWSPNLTNAYWSATGLPNMQQGNPTGWENNLFASATGSSTPFNVLQPYEVDAVLVRVA